MHFHVFVYTFVVYLRLFFKYVPSNPEKLILQDLSFEVPENKCTGFTGPAMCGKSTVFSLLQRKFMVNQGTITLDGTNINELNLMWLRENIGVVSQSALMFNRSVAENIRMAKPNASQSEIEEAAKKASVHHDIVNLDGGYEFTVGESGKKLSGGTRQRVDVAVVLRCGA